MLCTLSLMTKFLEEAAILAAKKRSRIIHFPEGTDMVERMARILVLIDHGLETKRHAYRDGPALSLVQPQREALVRRLRSCFSRWSSFINGCPSSTSA